MAISKNIFKYARNHPLINWSQFKEREGGGSTKVGHSVMEGGWGVNSYIKTIRQALFASRIIKLF